MSERVSACVAGSGNEWCVCLRVCVSGADFRPAFDAHFVDVDRRVVQTALGGLTQRKDPFQCTAQPATNRQRARQRHGQRNKRAVSGEWDSSRAAVKPAGG